MAFSSSRSSAANMGAPVRTATAMASLGRASTSTSGPVVLSWIRAWNVLSRISVTVTRATSACSPSITSAIRSWVIGRGESVPCSFIRMAAASAWPIQMGRKRLPSAVFSSTMGCLPTMSKLTP